MIFVNKRKKPGDWFHSFQILDLKKPGEWVHSSQILDDIISLWLKDGDFQIGKLSLQNSTGKKFMKMNSKANDNY